MKLKEQIMLIHLCCIFIIIFAISCGPATIKIDPYLKDKNSDQKDNYPNQMIDCKDKCKGLKGKQRADCNKNCNQQYQNK